MPSGADSSRDYYPLTYRDPTGETAVRNLMGRSVQLTWENGATIHLDVDTIRPLLANLTFRMSRKGHIWGAKRNAPDMPFQRPGANQHPTITKEN
ncbi:hypothetical protein [Microbacterium maritypicum]